MDDILNDKRFSHIVSDPRYKRIPKLERKVKIDKRFQSMFNDKRFTVKYTVDKRGRPVNNSTTEDLRRYYDMSSDSQSDDEDGEEKVSAINYENKSKLSLVDSENSSKVLKKKVAKKNRSPHSDEDEGFLNDGNANADIKQGREAKKITPAKHKHDTDSEMEERVPPQLDSDDSVDDEGTDSDWGDGLQLRAEEKLLFNDKAKAKLQDLTVDYARGEGVLTSSSSDDESDEESEEELDHGWGQLDQEAEQTDDATHRLALCNMDWDRIRAPDLMVLFNSFLPQDGLIRSIAIYPSEFGLERMKEEELHGPPELRGKAELVDFNDDEDTPREENENEEGNDYHMEKLRQYQLNRLKYFYAVIDCDSENTANKIYTECDGLEYESSSARLDLRFIPDDMTFDHEPREVCDTLPELSKYKPRFFTTTALQQSKVELTWDETNPDRTEIAQKVISGDVDRAELRTYLATSSSEDEDEESKENQQKDEQNASQDYESEDGPQEMDTISKYKALVQSIEEEEERKKHKDVEMEISWGIGLKEKAEELTKKKMKEQDELTPFQQYLEKRKDKKKQKKLEKKNKLTEESGENPYSDDDIPSDIDLSDPYFREEFEKVPKKTKKQKGKKEAEQNDETNNDKAELELLLLNETEGKNHFNFKAIQEQETESKKKKKRKKKLKKNTAVADVQDNADFEVNVKDDRFSALFNSHHFNIDPADPHYHATKGMELLVAEKLKRRQEDDQMPEIPNKAAKNSSVSMKKDTDMASLVKKVRSQTKLLNKNL
ncbi:ESF1 homolog isoform X2 [Bacillus rossius redtenbacheri]|uniref:ESF1 homolog isoform X2 n=1 Tax=Bacillus rossius redtenbacheri TaxID=93214 RepID=UPI002FDD0A8A